MTNPRRYTHDFIAGMEFAAALYEQVNPASDMERHNGDPGAGAMGAVIEFRDLIRKDAKTWPSHSPKTLSGK
jgi:hypothetical protein